MDFQVRKGLETPPESAWNENEVFLHLLYYPGCDCSFCRGLPDKCHEWGGIFFGLYRFAGGRGVRLCGLADRLYQPFHAAQVRQVQKTGICHIE